MCDEILFCFDGDRAGRAAAWRALENALPQIKEGRQIRFVFLPDGQDPDSYVQEHGAAAFEKALDNAMPLSDFLIEELSAQVDMDSVDGRARLAELATTAGLENSAWNIQGTVDRETCRICWIAGEQT